MAQVQVKESLTRNADDCFFRTLFNNPEHVLLQSSDAITFQMWDPSEGSIGSIHFIIDDGVAYSPYKSLFGGFEIKKQVKPEDLNFFYQQIEQSLRLKGVNRIIIILPANFYRNKRFNLMKKVLENHGFQTSLKYKNHHIELKKNTIASLFHPMEKRKLKKCNSQKLGFYQESPEMLPLVYNFISLCRKEKNHPLNMTYENLKESFERFPENYLIFTVRQNNEIYAATIAVVVNDKILYNFLPASPTRFNDLSPTVKLIEGLFKFAKSNNYKYLDLGVSTTHDGEDQTSLIDFKKHVGGIRSLKLKMEKALD